MKRAFTLVELLVVIAVIAVLAAILFPVFAKARERAKRVQCISNLHQIGMAVQEYLADYNEVYSYAWEPNSVRLGNRPALPQVMTAYVTDDHIWRCPSDTGEIFLNDPGALGMKTPPFWDDTMCFTSYGYLGDGWSKNYGRIGGYRASVVKYPTLGVIANEMRPWHERERAGDNLYYSPARQDVLYCDGHVAQRTRQQWGDDAILSVSP